MSLLGRATALATILPDGVVDDDGPLSQSEVRRGLRLSIMDGMFAQVYISVTMGAFLTGFALLLGAGNTVLGIVGAMPFLLQPLQILGAWLIERRGARKPLAVAGSLGRLLWLGLVALPYLPFSLTQRLSLLILTLLAVNALLALSVNAWTHWMTDLVPPRLRGRYFSLRNTAAATVAMGINYGAGVWLDRARAANSLPNGYAALIGLAVVCAAVSTFLLSRQPEPRMERRTRLPLSVIVTTPLRNPDFRRFMVANLVWQMALAVAAPFFGAHALSVLRLPFTTLATLDVITPAVSLATLPLWGQLADRYGHRRILLLCMIGVIPLPWFWVIVTPATVYWLYINAFISGIWWPGINLAILNRMMERIPREARGAYLALFAAVTGLAYFVASSLAGGFADALAGVTLQLGPLTVNNYEMLFITSSLIRAGVVLFGRKAL